MTVASGVRSGSGSVQQQQQQLGGGQQGGGGGGGGANNESGAVVALALKTPFNADKCADFAFGDARRPLILWECHPGTVSTAPNQAFYLEEAPPARIRTKHDAALCLEHDLSPAVNGARPHTTHAQHTDPSPSLRHMAHPVAYLHPFKPHTHAVLAR